MNRYSRYCEKHTMDGVNYIDGLVFKKVIYTGPVVIHVVEINQTLDLISYIHYGNPEYWWLIAMYNNIIDPYGDVVVGLELVIPSDYKMALESISNE